MIWERTQLSSLAFAPLIAQTEWINLLWFWFGDIIAVIYHVKAAAVPKKWKIDGNFQFKFPYETGNRFLSFRPIFLCEKSGNCQTLNLCRFFSFSFSSFASVSLFTCNLWVFPYTLSNFFLFILWLKQTASIGTLLVNNDDHKFQVLLMSRIGRERIIGK